jgi:hypothetical protein
MHLRQHIQDALLGRTAPFVRDLREQNVQRRRIRARDVYVMGLLYLLQIPQAQQPPHPRLGIGATSHKLVEG